MGNPTSPDAAADPALAAIEQFIEKQSIDSSSSGWKLKLPAPPCLSFDRQKRYLWELAQKYFAERADTVLGSMARRRFQIDDGNWRKIPAFRIQDAVSTIEESADFERSEKEPDGDAETTDD